MAKSLSMAQLKQLAAHGARARLAELRAEIAAITRAFPEVASTCRRGRDRAASPASASVCRVSGRIGHASDAAEDLGRRSGGDRRGAETLGGDQEEESGERSVALTAACDDFGDRGVFQARKADRQWIESFRAKHDPHSARLPAHFTLVFPVDTVPRRVEAELQTVAESSHPVSFAIRRTEVVRDAGGRGAHVFLVPDEGRAEIAALHDRLYAGALRPHLRTRHPVCPSHHYRGGA